MYAPPRENVTRELWQKLLHFVLPAPCLACDRPVGETRGSMGLCLGCRQRLVRWPRDGCGVCGVELEGAHLPAGYRCGACRRQTPPFERVYSAWSYQPPLDTVLTGLKFRRLEYLGRHLGEAMAELYANELADCDLVVPIPLHWRRYLSRGYNQAGTIARPLAAKLGLPIARVVRRRRPTPAQSQLSRAARQRNLRNAFGIRRPDLFRGRRVLLVDDVVTTGTTVRTAATCLRRAGAASVTVITAARTPESPSKPQATRRLEP